MYLFFAVSSSVGDVNILPNLTYLYARISISLYLAGLAADYHLLRFIIIVILKPG